MFRQKKRNQGKYVEVLLSILSAFNKFKGSQPAWCALSTHSLQGISFLSLSSLPLTHLNSSHLHNSLTMSCIGLPPIVNKTLLIILNISWCHLMALNSSDRDLYEFALSRGILIRLPTAFISRNYLLALIIQLCPYVMLLQSMFWAIFPAMLIFHIFLKSKGGKRGIVSACSWDHVHCWAMYMEDTEYSSLLLFHCSVYKLAFLGGNQQSDVGLSDLLHHILVFIRNSVC